jgi:hypothetical protein
MLFLVFSSNVSFHIFDNNLEIIVEVLDGSASEEF